MNCGNLLEIGVSNINKYREEFEKWCRENTKWDLYWSDNLQQYMDHQTNGAWMVFEHRQEEINKLQNNLNFIYNWIRENQFSPTETWLTCDVIDVEEFDDALSGSGFNPITKK